MRHPENKAGGHTLMEVLAALAILAILATVATQSWQGLVRSQRRAEGRAALAELMQQQERHLSLHGRYQSFDAGVPGALKSHSGPTPADSAYALGALPCEGESLARCVLLVARPGGAGARPGHADPACGTLSLDSRGRRGADGGVASCW